MDVRIPSIYFLPVVYFFLFYRIILCYDWLLFLFQALIQTDPDNDPSNGRVSLVIKIP